MLSWVKTEKVAGWIYGWDMGWDTLRTVLLEHSAVKSFWKSLWQHSQVPHLPKVGRETWLITTQHYVTIFLTQVFLGQNQMLWNITCGLILSSVARKAHHETGTDSELQRWLFLGKSTRTSGYVGWLEKVWVVKLRVLCWVLLGRLRWVALIGS